MAEGKKHSIRLELRAPIFTRFGSKMAEKMATDMLTKRLPKGWEITNVQEDNKNG
jgi:hypothetical protein